MCGQTTIPIKELLQSEWFSTDRLLLENEAPSDFAFAQIGGISDVAKHAESEQIRLENAIRVALLLTRSFASFCDNLDKNSEEECIDSIRIEDFFVTLAGSGDSGCSNQNSVDENEDELTCLAHKPTASQNQTTANFSDNDPLSAEITVAEDEDEVSEINEKSKQTEVRGGDLRAGFFSSFDNMGADAYEKFFAKVSNANTLDDLRKDVAHAKTSTIVGHKNNDAECLELGMGYFSRLNDLSELHEYHLSSRRVSLPTPEDSVTEKQNVIPDTEHTPPSKKSRTLLEIDIISPASIDTFEKSSYDTNDEKKIKLLGCFMYSVFTHGASPPPHYFPSYVPETA